jgi:AcrR family transcriptional regulator
MARRARKADAKVAETAVETPENRLIDAALTLAARQGWRDTSLAEIAAEAALPLHEAYALHSSKLGILNAFLRRIDRAALAGVTAESGEPWRDRLFDVIMRRFDALQMHKAGLRAMLRDSWGDPLTVLAAPALLRSMAWMLESAGLSAAGWRGRLRVHCLAGLYLSVLRVFFEDDSPDLTKTMAALDRRLRRAESLFRRASRNHEEGAPTAEKA